MADRHDVLSDPFTSRLIRIKAAQLCRRTDFSASDYDDLQQSMVVYLLEKRHLFDPARGNVEAFVTNALDSWTKMELRFRGRLKRRGDYTCLSLEGTTVEFNGDADPLDSMLGEADLQRRTHAAGRSAIDDADLRDAVDHAMSGLAPDDQELLRHVAEHGVAATAREWTRRRGRCVSRRQVEKAIRRMRARFEDAGLGES